MLILSKCFDVEGNNNTITMMNISIRSLSTEAVIIDRARIWDDRIIPYDFNENQFSECSFCIYSQLREKINYCVISMIGQKKANQHGDIQLCV